MNAAGSNSGTEISSNCPPPQFALRHLLLATTALACAFALLPMEAAVRVSAGGVVLFLIWLQYRLGWFRRATLGLTVREAHIEIAHDRLATGRVIIALILSFPVLGACVGYFTMSDGDASLGVRIFWVIWGLFSVVAMFGAAHLWLQASRPYVVTRRGAIYRVGRRGCRRIGQATQDGVVEIERRPNDGQNVYYLRLIPGDGPVIQVAAIPQQGFGDLDEAERVAKTVADFIHRPIRRLGYSPQSEISS
jgi:hypothetical protein